MSSQATFNVPELFDGNNFRDWSFRMKCYLMDEGLLDIVEPITDDEVALDSSNKNSMALDSIKRSCGASVLRVIEGISLAKDVWDTLEETYGRQSDADADAGGEENDADGEENDDDADAEENGADGEENDTDADADGKENGSDGEENDADGEEHDVDADAEENGADGEENDADADAKENGANGEENDADAEKNGADADAKENGADGEV